LEDPSTATRKRVLRRYARGLPVAGSADTSTAVLRRLLGLPELERPRTVALYAAVGREVPTSGIRRALGERGARLAYPRVAEGGLVLHQLDSHGTLRPGYRGIPEPAAEEPTVSPEEVDLFVIPGLLFDRAGNRLGRGGGHYDRLLAAARPGANRIGLCYAEQVIESVPVDDWDRPLDLIVTDREVIRVSPVEKEGQPT
jgi:5-formyltetrahydrofolate cyclo-ligase